ncbi:lipoyl synthase [Leptospira levettii]|uniref:Lipoyl synthase n=2 Tax=Leptospira levettii TaxID=2023178 RepID=A0ABY2MJR5_9LEPT|nr:lipoyl synthase [Leptospira levettii]TGM28458.1 lipoyl synthase [Leptospira levettii]TGM32908.1 lipoyl synthase [Leptospira levettii]TGM77349.1 lipoyl synthase [Leptospira levettii]TGM83192.1 lipoyl synthase [Leptospira levettii]
MFFHFTKWPHFKKSKEGMNPLKKKPRSKHLNPTQPLPDWMKVRVSFPKESDALSTVRAEVETKQLHTVCESASCPNLNHCWNRKTATYMLAGDICTRRCQYCDVAFGKPKPLDSEEPEKVARSVEALGLKHVVLTAVNRDDLKDGGANHFAATITKIKTYRPECSIEVLIPDFKAKEESLQILYAAKPNIINHNIETVERLFPTITPQKNYRRSLEVLTHIAKHGFLTKSGLILGLGETEEDVNQCLQDLYDHGVRMLTIGQYLQPGPTHYPVQSFIPPETFQMWKETAYQIGFKTVASGPLVRSSYHADEYFAEDSLNLPKE